MQSWFPEAFDADTAAAVLRPDGTGFRPDRAPDAVESAAPEAAGDRRFRREAGFSDPTTIMSHLSGHEREILFDLVEQDVSRRYEERESALRAELEAEQKARLDELAAASRDWAEAWSGAQEARLHELAAAAARLAVQLAGKIVRRSVEGEPEILVRAIETALFNSDSRGPLTVTVHPDDAGWLEEQPGLRQRLNLATIVPDRRVERGGCYLSAEGREWDATLESQLETLAEIVDEWIATDRGGAGDPRRDGSDVE